MNKNNHCDAARTSGLSFTLYIVILLIVDFVFSQRKPSNSANEYNRQVGYLRF